MKLKPLHEQTVVITGATSGIGLATAKKAVARGANVVLVARNREALERLGPELGDSTGRVVYAVADVADYDAVRAAADKAIAQFGGFDTWINNAGVSIYGRIVDVPIAEQRRLFDTNYWGVVNGSLVAVDHLRHRGGAIINIGSVLSDRAIPVQGPYSASKHAVKAFTDALRMEVEADELPVSITLVKPSSIATPYPEHARNYLEHEPKLPPPVYAPELVARAILDAAQRPRRDVTVGGAGKVMTMLAAIAPRLGDIAMERTMFRSHQSDEEARPRKDSLESPAEDGSVRGHHPGHVVEHSVYDRLSRRPLVSAAVAAGAFALLALIVRGR